MSSLAAKLKKGTKVKITTKGDFNGQIGVVKYVGPIQQKKAQGDYVGLELEKPIGKNNGTHNGKEYFKTKQNYGIFLKPTSLALMDGTPVVPPTAATKSNAASNKLSKDLEEVQKGEPQQQQKKQVPLKTQNKTQPKVESKVDTKIQQTKETTKQSNSGNQQLKAEVDQLKKKVKVLQQQNRTLKIDNQKVKYAVKEKDQGKEKELQQQIDFFKAQKQAIQKQKADLKKKNAQLNAQLEEYAQNMGMVDTLTLKIQNLEAKNQKLKQQLQVANSQLKNYKMTGSTQAVSQEQFNQNIKILNETITLLESDLKQMSDKNAEIEEQLKKRQASEGQVKKLQRKLKQKDQELQQMANQLQLVSDAAAFAQKLTLDMLKKDQLLKETTVKLNQYLNKVEILQGQLAINKEFQDEVNQQLFHQEELMDKYGKQIEQKNKHILQLNRQIQKYKKKIFELAQSSETASNMSASQIIDDKQDLTLSKPIFGDQYQNKYYNALKLNHEVRKKELKHMIQFSEIRNQVGVYMLNLSEALPESFTSKLYPEVISLLTAVKSANDKLYYIFTAAADTFKNKSDIYSKENQQLAQWYIVLMKEVIALYGCLHKIQFSFTTAQSQEQISQILDHRILKDEVRKINNFALEMLQKFVDDNISSTIDLQCFISCIESLDEINLSLKKNFTTEYDTKMRLCVDSMETVTNIYEAITKFKNTNELGENAQVDNALELFVKTVLAYVKQCCMNPYIRFKSQMKQYLNGLNLISNILNDIGVEGNYHELNSLYSQTQNIKMLRQTLLTTQYHANALENDLKDIVYTSQVSKIQTQLPGKFWQERIKQIKQELLKVKQISQDKAELQLSLVEAKKKNALLQRDIKDKQSTKELYQRRIGQLQLKVQQANSTQSQNKRQAQKIKSCEETIKNHQQQLLNLTKKYKLFEEQNKKLKQKYDTLQTETMMRNKKQNKLNTLSSQDVANLTIFKNAVKESNQLRVFDLKKKMMQLKQSPIFTMHQAKQRQSEKISSVRSRALDQISKFTINDPLATKKNSNEASFDSILLEIDRLTEFKKSNQAKNKAIKVGMISLSSVDGRFANVNETGLSIVVN